MSSRLSTLQPMGSYRITFNGGPVPSLQLDTIDGALYDKLGRAGRDAAFALLDAGHYQLLADDAA